jgi:hypothetical protein
MTVTLPVPVTDSEGIGTKEATPRKVPELSVDCELTEIVKLEPEPDLLVSVSTAPVADAVTGDVESELKALVRFEAIIEGVSDDPYVADFVNPFAMTETVPVSYEPPHPPEPRSLPMTVTLPVPLTDSEGVGTKDATPRKLPELSVDCELGEIAGLVVAVDLLESQRVLPVAIAMTADVESAVKALARLEAIVEGVSDDPYVADFVSPFTPTETLPAS